jgi:ubiquinone/menaquinone biosynthesis C-methylase UbiE
VSDRIGYNSWIHNLIAPVYESRHAEIFNQTEQKRLREELGFALGCVGSSSGAPRVLDFGAGTGNLTRHLLELGALVVASDVSSGCLNELRCRAGAGARLELSLLNGKDLSQFPDGSFDLVATYSVLHHVPDYLALIDEFVRVLKPGGVVCIDHEVCPAYWQERPDYRQYCTEVAQRQLMERESLWRYLAGILRRDNWWRHLAAAAYLRLKGVSEDEGDIHVHPDDHIEWGKIRSRLEPGCEVLREEDYLVCREKSVPPPVWQAWRGRCCDMRVVVARKR